METPTGAALQQLKIEIDRIPELRGAGIGFVGGGSCTLLRHSQHPSGLPTYVVLEEKEYKGAVPIRNAAEVPNPNLTVELLGVGLNCAGAVFSWAAIAGEGLAAPATGGAALALEVVTWSAARTTTVSCGLSLLRALMSS